MEWAQIAIPVMAGFTAIVTLVVKLIQYIQALAREKKWKHLLRMLIEFMEIAEDKFEDGTDKKRWVLSMVDKCANITDSNVDMQLIENLIDDLCDMSFVINPPISKKKGDDSDDS